MKKKTQSEEEFMKAQTKGETLSIFGLLMMLWDALYYRYSEDCLEEFFERPHVARQESHLYAMQQGIFPAFKRLKQKKIALQSYIKTKIFLLGKSQVDP